MNPSATWLFDIGNTRLKWARADRLDHDGAQALPHVQSISADALDAAFAGIRRGDRGWISTVASPALGAMVDAALHRRGAEVKIAATQSVCAGVQIVYAEPSRLGVDRFLALLAAHAQAKKTATLIASVGTALTIDLLAADGRHLGGLIAPSPTLMRESLAQRAPQLPVDGGLVMDFAADTVDALASGAILSARALIARSLSAARRQLGARPALLITGGGADAVRAGWRVHAEHVPDLVLRGLRVYAQAAQQLD